MDLPMRFFLIDQPKWKGILVLKIISIHDVLRLEFSLHQLTTTLTDSIRQSFAANQDNEKYFNMLPKELIKKFDISLLEAEQHALYLQSLLSQYPSNYNQYIHVGFHQGLQLWLFYSHIYGLYNFENNFVANYSYWKSIQSQLRVTTNVTVPEPDEEVYDEPLIKTSHNKDEDEDEDSSEIESEDHFEVISDNTDIVNAIQFANDCIKLSPNSLTTYFISKYVHDSLARNDSDLFDININNACLTITLEPLINLHLLSLSKLHISNFISLLSSIELSVDEYNGKLRLLTNQMLYIVFEEAAGRVKKESIILPLKIAEFLIFLYTMKIKGFTLPDQMDINSLNVFMLQLVNETVHHQFQHFNHQNLNFGRIVIQHSNRNSTPKIETKLDLNTFLAKERYSIDIDREAFIDNVFNDVINVPTKNDKSHLTVVLNSPTTIDIDRQYLGKDISKNSWLKYELITPSQKQLLRNNASRIITNEYYQLLQLEIMPRTIVDDFIKSIDPRLARYADIILNYIFKELSMEIKTGSTVSTLYLLNMRIRPYLPANASVDTEMFILYRCVIPYLYDLKYINTFVDFFH